MNLMHLRSSEFFGGPEKAILGQCRALRGHDFLCASFVRAGHQSEFLKRCGAAAIETCELEQRHVLDGRPIGLLRRKVVERNIRVVVSHDYKSNLFAMAALRGLAVVQIAHFRGRTAEDLKVRFYNFLDGFVLRRLDRVFVVCEAARKELAGQGVDPGLIRVVPNGFDTSRALHGVERKLPQDDRSPVRFIAAGRLSREKGFDILVDAVALLGRKGRAFHVDVYGSGPEEVRLEEQMRRRGVSEQITLHGFTHDLHARLREAHALIIPSRSEGMPNVLLEAWASGLAVIATPVGGVPEMIEDRRSGILSREVTPESLAQAMEPALIDPQRLQVLAEAGQERLKSRFGFDRQAELLDVLYREAAEEKGHADRMRGERP